MAPAVGSCGRGVYPAGGYGCQAGGGAVACWVFEVATAVVEGAAAVTTRVRTRRRVTEPAAWTTQHQTTTQIIIGSTTKRTIPAMVPPMIIPTTLAVKGQSAEMIYTPREPSCIPHSALCTALHPGLLQIFHFSHYKQKKVCTRLYTTLVLKHV